MSYWKRRVARGGKISDEDLAAIREAEAHNYPAEEIQERIAGAVSKSKPEKKRAQKCEFNPCDEERVGNSRWCSRHKDYYFRSKDTPR